MKITWLDIKESINRLMFLDSTEYDANKNSIEYANNVIEAANFALVELDKEFPLLDTYTITQAESEEEGYNEYDIRTLTMSGDNVVFNGFDKDTPALINDDYGWHAPDIFQIFLDRYLYLPKDADGTYKVVYRKNLTRITAATANTFEMELKSDVCNIMPLLMAYRVYKDDDPYKASQYYNEYMQAKALLPKDKVVSEMYTIVEGEYNAI